MCLPLFFLPGFFGHPEMIGLTNGRRHASKDLCFVMRRNLRPSAAL